MPPHEDMPSIPDGVAVADGYEGISAGVDWVTMIVEGRREVEELEAAVRPIGWEQTQQGGKTKPFSFMGFKGHQTEGVRLGFRGDTAVTQLSGEVCRNSWTRLPSSSGRVTRLDLQATVMLSTARKHFARSLLRPATKIHRKLPQRRPRVSYSSDTQGLAIGTVGRRTSPRYLRVYDKGVESGTAAAGTKWRVELEAKQGLAGVLWREMQKQPNAEAWCYGTCEVQWKSSGHCWPLPASSTLPALLKAPEKGETPAAALAAWLRSSVAPTIPRVLTCYSVSEVLELLGLDHLAIPTSENRNRE